MRASIRHSVVRNGSAQRNLIAKLLSSSNTRLLEAADWQIVDPMVTGNSNRYPSPRSTILLVEDEPELRRQILTFLHGNNFQVLEAATAAEARAVLQRQPVSLALIDIGLGSDSGWQVLLDCRELGAVPAIIITASVDLKTRVKAFSEGAVDYIAKPFYIEELLSRINIRLLKQHYDTDRNTIEFEQISIDLAGRSVTVDGVSIALTEAEFDILAYLAARSGRAVSRATLADEALRQGSERSDRTIDSHVSRIRTKLGPKAVHIATCWGIGWKFIAVPK